MADYPTASDYQEALQVPRAALTDPELQGAIPRTNALGLPQPITGSFAAVFPVTTETGAKYAIKCFLRERPEQQARYEAVAQALDAVDHDAFVPFEYQPGGIRVEGTAYPLLKMKWAEGCVLNRFVEAHLDQPEVLDRLAEAWAALMSDLEAMDLAHGDLQHGNVLVDSAGEALQLRLVDYDTLYVPALKGRSSAEVGHRNYQHPDRTDADFGPDLDRFAGLVIYVALRACAARPALWETYNTSENLLFRDTDFYAPEESPLFGTLMEIDSLNSLVEGLRAACYQEPRDVPSLEAVREGRVKRRPGIRTRSRTETGSREKRDAFARFFLPGGVGVGLGAIGLFLAGWPLGALGFLLGSAGVGGGMAALRYRRLSVVRRRRRLEQEAERFAASIRELEREVQSLQDKREALLTSMEERREERLREVQEEALHDCLKHHFVGEVREVEGLTHKHVVRLKAAGIRTAAEATLKALDAVQRISDRARARLKTWRSTLEERYADQVPDALSPAQKRRLKRYVEHRLEDLDAQRARTREKIQAQEVEHDRVRERLDEMPEMTFGRYVRYLFRLGTLPNPTDDSPPPRRTVETADAETRSAVPDPLDDDRSWWVQRP